MMENEVGGLDEDDIACGQKRSPMIGVLLVELPSTTLVDLLTPLFVANPFSTMRASLWR